MPETLIKPYTFVNWFDPHNPQHIQAYAHYKDIGTWPKSFIVPQELVFTSKWKELIINKLANAWIEHILSNIRE